MEVTSTKKKGWKGKGTSLLCKWCRIQYKVGQYVTTTDRKRNLTYRHGYVRKLDHLYTTHTSSPQANKRYTMYLATVSCHSYPFCVVASRLLLAVLGLAWIQTTDHLLGGHGVQIRQGPA